MGAAPPSSAHFPPRTSGVDWGGGGGGQFWSTTSSPTLRAKRCSGSLPEGDVPLSRAIGLKVVRRMGPVRQSPFPERTQRKGNRPNGPAKAGTHHSKATHLRRERAEGRQTGRKARRKRHAPSVLDHSIPLTPFFCLASHSNGSHSRSHTGEQGYEGRSSPIPLMTDSLHT